MTGFPAFHLKDKINLRKGRGEKVIVRHSVVSNKHKM